MKLILTFLIILCMHRASAVQSHAAEPPTDFVVLDGRVLTVDAVPPVQLLVPGFSVRELTLLLRNLINLVSAPDGRHFTLGYGGTGCPLQTKMSKPLHPAHE